MAAPPINQVQIVAADRMVLKNRIAKNRMTAAAVVANIIMTAAAVEAEQMAVANSPTVYTTIVHRFGHNWV